MERNTPKLCVKDIVIIIGLLAVLGLIIFQPIQDKLNSLSSGTGGDQAAEIEDVSAAYQKCIERADSRLPSVNSRVSDPMTGTRLSRENLAASDRQQCQRTYEFNMRTLRSRQY